MVAGLSARGMSARRRASGSRYRPAFRQTRAGRIGAVATAELEAAAVRREKAHNGAYALAGKFATITGPRPSRRAAKRRASAVRTPVRGRMAGMVKRKPMPSRDLLGTIETVAADVSRLHGDRERAQAWVWRLEEDVHEVRLAAGAATEPVRRRRLNEVAEQLAGQLEAERAALSAAQRSLGEHMTALSSRHAPARELLRPSEVPRGGLPRMRPAV